MAPPITDNLKFLDEMASRDHRQALEALLGKVALEIYKASGRNVAALVKVALDILKELAKLRPAGSKTPELSLEEELRRRHRRRVGNMEVSDEELQPKRRGGGARRQSWGPRTT
jgi:hypothetical protein